MLKDALLAQDIVRNTNSNINLNDVFHESSFIYKKTNERLQDIQDIFENKSIISTVIASGDQIINAISHGTKYIYAFDISVFPAYFLKLKLAAIKGLTRDEYVDFFFGDILSTKDEYYDDLFFDKINKYLDKDTSEFWSYLFNYNDWYDIYNSLLFSREMVSERYSLIQNRYLDENNYNTLKKLVDDVFIVYDVCDVRDYQLPNNKAELVYLSNIIQYINPYEYNQIVHRLTESCNGDVVSYVFCEEDLFSDYLTSVDNEFKKIDSNSILIHKKKHI